MTTPGKPKTFEADQVRRFLTEIFDPHVGCFELRFPRSDFERSYIVPFDRFKKTLGGYYDQIGAAILDLQRLKGVSAYVTINPVTKDLLARFDNRIAMMGKGESTDDANIVRLDNIFIDVDSLRDTGISSTAAEYARALAVRDEILADHPEIARSSWWGSSGNGGWILVRTAGLPNDSEHNAQIERFLATLGRKYTGERARVDQTTKNPSRIMCVAGTRKCKGSDRPERPWRLATIDSPEGHAREPIDLGGWLDRHGYVAEVGHPGEGAATPYRPMPGRQFVPGGPTGPLSIEDRVRLCLDQCKPSIQGQDGSAALMSAMNIGPGFDVPPQEFLRIIDSHYNVPGRCDPPWSPGEMEHAVENIYRREPRRGWLMEASRIPLNTRVWPPMPAAENGQATQERGDGHAANGHANGHAANGHTNGHANGQATNGHAANGHQPPPPRAPRNPRSRSAGRKQRPVIQCRDVSLETATAQTLEVLSRTNDPPTMFDFSGSLSWIKESRERDGRDYIEPMSHDALRNRLAEIATFLETTETEKGPRELEVFPPFAIIRAVAAQKRWADNLAPPLELLVPTPRFLPGGGLVVEPGYHPESRIFYRPPASLDFGAVPESPTDDDVADARGLILDEYLHDFPFDDPASRANALACMLLPFVRLMFDGPTPIHVFEASTEGTGKSKLANACAFPSLGRELSSTSQKEDESEWRKALTTTFMAGGSHVYIDNLYNPRGHDGSLAPIDSANLAMALTQPEWEDRILGGNRQVRIRIRCIWMASGNNIEWSKELARRVVPIRLLVPSENPSERKGFRCEPDTLEEWAAKNWGRLIRACLVLCRRWVADGMPAGKVRMGSYEGYSRVMGGILHSAGVVGFLENRAKEQGRDRESTRWPAFVHAWHARFHESPVSSTDLHGLMFGGCAHDGSPIPANADLQVAFADIVGDKSPLSQKQKLGRSLTKQEDRVYGDFRVVRCAMSSPTGNNLYRLARILPGETGGGSGMMDGFEDDGGGGGDTPF